MPTTLGELARMIAKRDRISINEAWDCINEAKKSIDEAIFTGRYGDIEDILHYDLGLEPDYMELFLV